MSKSQANKRFAIIDIAFGAAAAAKDGNTIMIDEIPCIDLPTAHQYSSQKVTLTSVRNRIKNEEMNFIISREKGKSVTYYVNLEFLDSIFDV